MTTHNPHLGIDCPPWCVTDHGKYSFHGSARIAVAAAEYRTFHVRAIQHPGPGHREIQVGGDCLVYVRSDDAADLAVLIEQLAGATPEQHRELAAAIRQAATGITDGSQS